MSHALLQLNGRWTRKAVAIARHLRDSHGFSRFSGFSTADYHARWVRDRKDHDVEFATIITLPDLWREAIAKPQPDMGRLRELEDRYGPLTRYVIADRHIGHQLLPMTILPDCALNKAISRNPHVALKALQLLFDKFEELFARERPDVLFCQVLATAPSYVACAVAQRHNVPFLVLGKTKLDDRHHFSRSALMQPDAAAAKFFAHTYNVAKETLTRYETASTKPPHTDHYDADLRNHAKRHGTGGWRPLLNHLLQLPSVLTTIVYERYEVHKGRKLPLVDPREPTRLENWQWEWRVKRNFKRLLDRNIFTRRIPEVDFAFFPLSVTPEASTCVVAPHLADQLVAVDACVRSLPLEWMLVVKDHLPMCGRRTPDFYQRMLATGRVVLLDPTIRSTEVLDRARLTITIAGTSGWEALLLGSAVVTLGPAWYLATGLAAYCPNPAQLSVAIHRALELRNTISPHERRERLIGMLQCLLDESFPFAWKLMWQNLTPEEMREAEPTWKFIAEKIATVAREKIPFHPIFDHPWIPEHVIVH